ncbi:hypothetical protein HHI36_019800 [Cryptolaemus montrouzieri]|uniref:Peptidase S1 domain-containing protein n=1 Tax=Cryptolaemus montrouzieri TaxID=559131 RepID=A0ABD2N8P8_9CUCU
MFKIIIVLVILCHLQNVYSLKPKVHPPHRKSGGRIIGGGEAIPHAYPYQVGLSINNGISFCGGTLISINYVITAAHCGVVISEVEVILGAHNITEHEKTQVRLKGIDVIIHEQYDASLYRNDIALIKLNQSVTLSYAIQTVQLPSFSQAQQTYENLFTLVTGWGLVKDEPVPSVNDISDTLQVVSVPVMNTDVCAEYYNDDDLIYITKTNLCTSGYQNKGTCKGDSGGPLVYDERLIGIASLGTTKCEECYPSIFTRVGAYLEWIQKNSDVHIDT